jgi:hypothetical protein
MHRRQIEIATAAGLRRRNLSRIASSAAQKVARVDQCVFDIIPD